MSHHPIQPLARALRRGLFAGLLATAPVLPSMVQAEESTEALRLPSVSDASTDSKMPEALAKRFTAWSRRPAGMS